MQLIPAKKKDLELLREVEQFSSDKTDFHLWWLGQSGYLLLWKGHQILIDPYLSDSLTKKYATTAKPHVRISERVIDPELFRHIEIVSSSHNHTDHLDGETLIPLLKNNPGISFVIPEANRAFVCERVNIPLDFPDGLNDKSSLTLGEFTFHGIPAKHNEIDRDDLGNCKYMGYVIQFGPWSVYHSGDTLWFHEMPALLKPFGVHVALLPINGNDPARGVAGNLDTKEAAELGKAINAGIVIPCHYDLFEFNTADPKIFEAEAKKIQQAFCILEPETPYFSSAQLRS